MATNTYTYGSLGERWVVETPTSKANLDISRVKADANRWTLTQLLDDPDDSPFALANGTTATTQSASDNSTKIATTAYVDASSTSPGGSNTQIQYNNSGAFGASANLTFDGSTLTVAGALSATGNISFDGGSFVFNESGADKDFRIEGDSEENLFRADASTDRIGIGVAAPAANLHVETDKVSSDYIGYFHNTRTSDGGAQYGVKIEAGFNTHDDVFKVADGNDNKLFQIRGNGNIEAGLNGGWVGIGAAPTANLHVETSKTTGDYIGYFHNSRTSDGGEQYGVKIEAGFNLYDAVFHVANGSNSKMFQIDGGGTVEACVNGGNMLVGTTDPANGGRFKVLNSDGEYTAAFFNSHSSSPYGLYLYFSGDDPDNSTTNHFLHCKDTSADRLIIWSDGDVANHDGTYGTLSDAKLKQDITDMRSYWGDFSSLQYRKYRHKTDVEADPDAPYRIGLVAQEVESVFPSLVQEGVDQAQQDVAVLDADGNATYEQTEKLDAEGNVELDADGNAVMTNKLDDDGNAIPITETKTVNLGTVTKWVKSSIIEGPIMASVVQELQTRLEAAEAKIAALEAA